MKEVRNFDHGIIECFSYLKKHDLENYVKEEATDPEGDEDKTKHTKDPDKAKRIISISIEDHLISYVSSLKTHKEMFNALIRLYEGNNINMKMTMRTQLNDVKMQMSERIQSYFTRVSQIKE